MKLLSQHTALIESVYALSELALLPAEWCLLDADTPLPEGVLPENCIVLTSRGEAHDVIATLFQSGFSHIISTDHPQFGYELKVSLDLLAQNPRIYSEPHHILLRDELYGSSQMVLSVTNKSDLLDKLAADILHRNYTTTLTQHLMSVSDELIMNAIHDAPKIASAHEALPADFFWAGSHDRILVGVRDHYGLLNKDKLIKRLHTVYQEGMGQAMNMGSGGAGIGMRIVVDQGSSLYLIVDPGRLTIVCCAFSLQGKRLSKKIDQKSVHISVKRSL